MKNQIDSFRGHVAALTAGRASLDLVLTAQAPHGWVVRRTKLRLDCHLGGRPFFAKEPKAVCRFARLRISLRSFFSFHARCPHRRAGYLDWPVPQAAGLPDTCASYHAACGLQTRRRPFLLRTKAICRYARRRNLAALVPFFSQLLSSPPDRLPVFSATWRPPSSPLGVPSKEPN